MIKNKIYTVNATTLSGEIIGGGKTDYPFDKKNLTEVQEYFSTTYFKKHRKAWLPHGTVDRRYSIEERIRLKQMDEIFLEKIQEITSFIIKQVE